MTTRCLPFGTFGSFGLTSLAILATLPIAFAACRPDVELAIPCDERGALSCPSGHHCGPHGACEPGEAAPTISVNQRLHHEVLSGSVDLEATVASPLGLVDARASLRSIGDGTVIEPDATLGDFDDRGTLATLRVQVKTWLLEDGPAVLVLNAWAQGDAPPGQLEIPVTIANGRATIQLSEPLPEVPIETPHFLSIHVSSLVELRRIGVSFGGDELAPVLEWHGGERLEATVNVLLDPAGLSEEEVSLLVTAVDLAYRESVLEVPVRIGSQE